MSDARTRRWQAVTLITLFAGYTGYYVCRSNLSVATPLLLDDLADTGLTREDIGNVASLGVIFYALGKLTNGLATDFVGGRVLFLFGMAGSVVCTLFFGLATGLGVFLVVWAVNRYVQSMGWSALVKVASRWYPVAVHGRVMGVLSMSYLIGDALCRAYLGVFIGAGLGWRGVFFVAAGTLAVVAIGCWVTLRDSPGDVGAEEPPANPRNVFGDAGQAGRAEGLGSLLGPLVRNPVFWLVCVMCFGLTMIRETFTFWTPTILKDMGGMTAAEAAWGSAVFPLVGGLSALCGGWLSDRAKGRHGRMVLPSLVLLVAALAVFGLAPAQGRPLLTLGLIAGVATFLLAPYAYCAGVAALDLGGKRGSATVAGLIDTVGYLGGIVSGRGVAGVVQSHGWSGVFLALAGVAALTVVAAVVYWVLDEFRTRSVLDAQQVTS
jgi:MFS transporter, OPA family, glycerol-3-phosphate transporter